MPRQPELVHTSHPFTGSWSPGTPGLSTCGLAYLRRHPTLSETGLWRRQWQWGASRGHTSAAAGACSWPSSAGCCPGASAEPPASSAPPSRPAFDSRRTGSSCPPSCSGRPGPCDRPDPCPAWSAGGLGSSVTSAGCPVAAGHSPGTSSGTQHPPSRTTLAWKRSSRPGRTSHTSGTQGQNHSPSHSESTEHSWAWTPGFPWPREDQLILSLPAAKPQTDRRCWWVSQLSLFQYEHLPKKRYAAATGWRASLSQKLPVESGFQYWPPRKHAFTVNLLSLALLRGRQLLYILKELVISFLEQQEERWSNLDSGWTRFKAENIWWRLVLRLLLLLWINFKYLWIWN